MRVVVLADGLHTEVKNIVLPTYNDLVERGSQDILRVRSSSVALCNNSK